MAPPTPDREARHLDAASPANIQQWGSTMANRWAPTPQSVQVPVQANGSNGLAVAGFVLAFLGALSSFIPVVNIGGDILAFLGLVFGIIGLVKSRSRRAGRGLSIAAIILAVAAFIISIAINGAAVTAVNNAVKTMPSVPAASAVPAAPAAPAKTTAKVGDTITLSGSASGSKAAVTAMKVVDPTTSTDGFSTPAAGSRYVAVQFQIQNTGTVAYDDAPSNGAKVIDVSGQQFDSTLTSSVSAGPIFPASLKVPPGEKALGYIVFEVPTTSKVAAVQFSMDSGFSDSGEWTIK
jgi:hypothetical protein